MRTAIYTRISSDRDGDRLGVQRQEAECRELCTRRRWTVAAVYEDDDRSAYSGKRRPGYHALLEAVRHGEVQAIVAWHPDRLHRSPRELEDFIDLVEQTGTKVATVQAGEYDLSTASGRMTARVVGAVARGESEHKSERAKAKARELARAGKVGGGGWRPFGYTADRRHLEPTEAALVRHAVDRFLSGDSLRSICADWIARGIPTVTGAKWTTVSLRRVLFSARIAGWREHHGVLVTEAEWPAIITLDELHAVRAILADPDRLKRRTASRYLLTGGILVCGQCGAAMVARPTQDKRRKYTCATGPNFKGCGKAACMADPLEDEVVEALMDVIAGLDLDSMLTPALPVGFRAEIEAVEAQLDDLAETFAAGTITQREWMVAREGLSARLSELRGAETQAVGQRAARADVAALRNLTGDWDTLSIQRRRDVVALLIERVTLGPAVKGRNFFDSSRVDVTWRI